MIERAGHAHATDLPVVVVGAGPIGLAAAIHVAVGGDPVLVLESGDTAGCAVRKWGHVRMFSPWKYNVDPLARIHLVKNGWREPNPDALPTGAELVDELIKPMSQLPMLQGVVQYGTHVTGVTRFGADRLRNRECDTAPFLVRVHTDGVEQDIAAKAVIDASGTFANPNPLGAGGLPAIGERHLRERIYWGIPNVARDRERFVGKRILIVGSGDSASNALLALTSIVSDSVGTEILWGLRGDGPRFGGGGADQLVERGRLGSSVERLVDQGRVRVVSNLRIEALRQTNGYLDVVGDGAHLSALDEVVAVTGYRPDLAMLGELRLDTHASTESPEVLGPLIDPNIHSCGTVPPHGARELQHTEKQFFTIGMKSYGRAPTFLLMTGYEQARSVVSAIRGDWQSATEVRLTLPETGVCSTADASAAAHKDEECCG